MAAKQKVTRKLRAILSADVKGYSTLMTNDEIFTIQTLKKYRRMMSQIIKKHSGRVVDSPGDNILAEFSSIVNAVQSAVEIQKALKKENADVPDDKKLEFRIGVNIGDVVQDGGSLYGEGVNIAARIEGLSDPGGVCISRGAYDHIRNKLKLGYEYIGEHTVKNIKHPVRVYKLLIEPADAGKLIGGEPKPILQPGTWANVIIAAIVLILIGYQVFQKITAPEFEPASVEKMTLPLPDKPSIAVLAFDNMSEDPEQEYFSDGISEDIITTLSKSSSLFVVARNSTFRYKGKPADIKRVAEELGVRYVLEGSVRKSDDRVRITAQLIDAIAGNHLWAERYDRDIKDIFALQDEITMAIATALQVKLTEGDQAYTWSKKNKNITVYLKILEAFSLVRQGTKESIIRFGQIGKEIVDMAPESATGYRILGWYNYQIAFYGKSARESFAKAFKFAQKALSIDESDASVHNLLSRVYLTQKNFEKAVAVAKRAVELEPNGADVHLILGSTLSWVGRTDEAILYIDQAIRLNPFPTYEYYYHLGRCYRQKGEYEKAINFFEKAVNLSPNAMFNQLQLACTYALLDRQEEAQAAVKKLLTLNPKISLEFVRGWPYKNQLDLKLFVDALRKAGLPEKPPLSLPVKPSIAVLAFDNMTGDSTLEYFCDGIAEEIINVLSNAKELFVIARNSSFSYKNKSVKVQQISKELGIRYVLEGSVRKSGNKVRVTAQLIDASNGQHLWSKNYNRDFDNIFEIQDEISMEVVTSLQVELTEGEQARMFLGKNRTPELYKQYLQSLSLWREGTRESKIQHAQLAKEIVDASPESEIGYRSLGWNHWYLAMGGISPKENIKKAFELAQKAISIDDANGFSHSFLCAVYMSMKNYEKAIASGRRAITLQPNGAQVHFILGQTLMYAGRLDEAILYMKQAFRLNPFPPHFYYSYLGRCYMLRGQLEDALSEFNKAVKRAPSLHMNHLLLAVNYIYLDRNEEARASAEKTLELWPKLSVSHFSKMSKYKNQAHTQFIIDAMRKAGFPE